MLVLALQFSRGQSSRNFATGVAKSTLVDQKEERLGRSLREYSLKTEEKTMYAIHAAWEARPQPWSNV